MVAREPLDWFDQHGVHPQLQLVGELVLGEELEVPGEDGPGPAVVDAVPAVFPRQPSLLALQWKTQLQWCSEQVSTWNSWRMRLGLSWARSSPGSMTALW